MILCIISLLYQLFLSLVLIGLSKKKQFEQKNDIGTFDEEKKSY